MRAQEQKEETVRRSIMGGRPASSAHGRMGAGPARGKHISPVELVAAPRVRQSLRPLFERFSGTGREGSGVFCVSSALAGEGKTVVSAALALMLTERSEKRVLLIDANLRRPDLHQLLGVPLSPGLAECVRGDCAAWDATSVVGTLCVLPSGVDRDPAWLLKKASAKRLLDEARSSYDLTFVDLPPLAYDEAPTLIGWSDGLLLVVSAGSTKASAVTAALASIEREKLLGVVLNREQPDLPPWLRRLL